jgi:hypothetical protein
MATMILKIMAMDWSSLFKILIKRIKVGVLVIGIELIS